MLTLFKRHPDYKTGGHFGMIFFHSDNRAVKVFRNNNNLSRDFVENVFNSEVAAYNIAQTVPEISALVPKFFGKVKVAKILNAVGLDISNEFHLDLAYEMDRIVDDFVAISLIPLDIRSQIDKLFASNGIKYTSDCDVIFNEGNVIKVIDFATEEYRLYI